MKQDNEKLIISKLATKLSEQLTNYIQIQTSDDIENLTKNIIAQVQIIDKHKSI